MGRDDLLAVEDFKANRGRILHQEALKQIIEEWLATLSSDDEAIRILADDLRLPAARVLSVGQIARDPILSERMVAKMPKAGGGEMMLLRSPHKFSRTPPEIPGPAATLGQHTSEILRTVCGYPDEKINALKQSGVIVETQPD